ncbi:MAG: hypothetical protein JRH19_24630 [Deltaproteobacteria bacterium]|nr:hypothetical protein [Deltaproteobacteria bacterium]
MARFGYDATDRPTQIYAFPSAPAVIDSDSDGYADVVYIGDLGGQMWKWDLSNVGEDTAGDSDIDNWASGVFFETAPVTLVTGDDAGDPHHRQFFFPPQAAFVKGKLLLAFGSGERHDMLYQGDPGVADENRFYVVEDPNPTGGSAFPGALDESDLTDITSLDYDNDLTDSGYYFDLADGEKFVTDTTIFAGHVIAGSYVPVSGALTCDKRQGDGYIYIFDLVTGAGFYANDSDPPSEDRRTSVGDGVPATPTVLVADDPEDDMILIKTSDGPRIFTMDAPERTPDGVDLIYWRVVK